MVLTTRHRGLGVGKAGLMTAERHGRMQQGNIQNQKYRYNHSNKSIDLGNPHRDYSGKHSRVNAGVHRHRCEQRPGRLPSYAKHNGLRNRFRALRSLLPSTM